jgi:cytochrome o ubiquinol oxidase subunit 2
MKANMVRDLCQRNTPCSRRTGGTHARVVRKWARTGGIFCAGALLASCREGVLDPHGPVGQAERVILYDATTIMLAVVIPVIILTLAFAWWFRAGNRRATYRPD